MLASYTSNYNLKKPASTDFINVQDLNDNADLIDTAIKNAESAGIAAQSTADAALPEGDFTGANILAELAADNNVLPVANGGTGANNASTAIRNIGDSSGVFLIRNAVGDGATVYDATSLTKMGCFLTPVSGTSNFPDFFAKYNGEDTGRKNLICFDVGNVSDYNGYLAFDHYSQEIAARMGISKDWRRLATDLNLASMVQSLLTGGNISMVRQIIKGTVAMTGTSNVSVTVSLTNAAKAYVEIDGNGGEPYLVSLTTTALTLKNNVSASYTASYQIVEYY